MLAQVPGHRAPWAWHLAESPLTWERQTLLNSQALSAFPKLGRVGRVQQTLQLPSTALSFFLLEIFSCTLGHLKQINTCSKSSQGV